MAAGTGWPLSSDRSFERLYRRHVDDVYRYALAVLANRSDAEDVTQTTFLNAYRSYQSGTLPAKPLNWLISIAHNVCRQRFRSAARRPSEVALDAGLAAENHEEGFRAEDIRRALAALTFAQRSALALRELEGRSYREIAEALQLSEGAVETLIFRARKAFREQLEGTLTCTEAERAISRELDGALERAERGALRSHLRECEECSVLARRFRAQRSAFKRFVVVPLPQSLATFSAGGSGVAAGGAAVGAGLGIKALALGSAAIVAAGVTTGEIVTHSGTHPAKAPAAAPHRAAPPVPRTSFAVRRAVPAATTSVVASVEVSPAVREAVPSGKRVGQTHHPRRTRPAVHRAHEVPRSSHVVGTPVAEHPVMQGNTSHSSTKPTDKQATRHEKPKPAVHLRKQAASNVQRTTHPTPKKQPKAAASTPKSSPEHGSSSTVAADQGPASDPAHTTGKPDATPGGPSNSHGQENDKHENAPRQFRSGPTLRSSRSSGPGSIHRSN
jgi:RNA polymerase sigma factor (sigma-70 family)